MWADRGLVECETCGKYSDHLAVKDKSVLKNPGQLMLCKETIAVCSQIGTKYINAAVWVVRRFVEC